MSQFSLPSRSFGLKFLLVCGLAVLMALPAFAVFGLIYERTQRAREVVQEVGQRYGGEQTFTGPVLVAPYRQTVTPPPSQENPRPQPTVRDGWYVIFADSGIGEVKAEIEERQRGSGGLFKVRVYEAGVNFSGQFDLTNEPMAAPERAVIDWSRAAVLVGVSDPRGAAAPAAINVSVDGGAARQIPLEPGSAYAGVLTGPSAVDYQGGAIYPGSASGSQWLAAPAGAFAKPGAKFAIASQLRFKGVESIGLTAFARDTELSISGVNWRDVGYFGAFATASDDVGKPQPAGAPKTFEAKWSVPFIARGLAQSGDAPTVANFTSLDARVRLIDTANPYKSVERALKYALMFIGVVFLAYFLMEATSRQRLHPAQYILVGLAQIIFYLLLLSLAERVGFDAAFLIAAGGTVLLIGWYAGAAFKSFMRGVYALIAFAALYGLIYMLMRLEDYALLAGSIAAFLAVAAVMFFTRNLDWYGLGRAEREEQRPAS